MFILALLLSYSFTLVLTSCLRTPHAAPLPGAFPHRSRPLFPPLLSPSFPPSFSSSHRLAAPHPTSHLFIQPQVLQYRSSVSAAAHRGFGGRRGRGARGAGEGAAAAAVLPGAGEQGGLRQAVRGAPQDPHRDPGQIAPPRPLPTPPLQPTASSGCNLGLGSSPTAPASLFCCLPCRSPPSPAPPRRDRTLSTHPPSHLIGAAFSSAAHLAVASFDSSTRPPSVLPGHSQRRRTGRIFLS